MHQPRATQSNRYFNATPFQASLPDSPYPSTTPLSASRIPRVSGFSHSWLRLRGGVGPHQICFFQRRENECGCALSATPTPECISL